MGIGIRRNESLLVSLWTIRSAPEFGRSTGDMAISRRLHSYARSMPEAHKKALVVLETASSAMVQTNRAISTK